jgi:L-ascorbate metabolism protein UlaG (beta-lactamase superfamily)
MGDYGESDNPKIINLLSGVDVLFIPIGGTYTIDAKTAKYYIEKIKPKTVIPIHYKINGSTVDIDKIDEFLKLVDGYKTVASPYNYNNDSGVLVIAPNKEI